MTEYRWIPWFIGNNTDRDNFDNRLNWAQIIPGVGAEIPASAVPGPSDLVVFGKPPSGFQAPGGPSGQINGDATTGEMEFDQVSNPPPLGWFINGHQTTVTLQPLSGGTIHVAGTLTVTGNVDYTDQPSTIELDGTGSVELDGSAGLTTIAFTEPNQSVTLKGASVSIYVNNFQSHDSIILPGKLTTSAVYGATGELDVYNGPNQVATINFNNGVDEKAIVPQTGQSSTNLVVDPVPTVKLQDPPGNMIDWDFIHKNEAPGGQEVLEPYVPVYNDPTNKSGITVGLGVDFGSGLITEDTLTRLFTADWPTNPNISFLANAIGDQGQSAVSDLEAGATQTNGSNLESLSVSLTESEADALSTIAEQSTYSSLLKAYNAASATPFTSLLEGEQTAVMDMAFNFPLTKLVGYDFWDQVILNTAHGWDEAYDNLLFWGGQDYLYSRRIMDARLIGQYLTNPTLPPSDIPYSTKKDGTTIYNPKDVQEAYYERLDPSGTGVYTLTEDPGSPYFRSIILPAVDAAGYAVQLESGATWSAPQIAKPLQEIIFPQNVDAIQVGLLDGNGAPIGDPTNFTFFVSFASTGTFSGVITEPTPSCFGKGTLIATEFGERPVESLQVGDAVVVERPCQNGRPEKIKRIRHRRLRLATGSDLFLKAPIRIRAGAVGPNTPTRDLILSPDHCIFVHGCLLRAYRLINGKSIAQECPPVVDYYYIELEEHGLVLAEGLAVETYLNEGGRSFFNGKHDGHDPVAERVSEKACAPLAPDDAFAERLWREIAGRAGVSEPKPDCTPGHLTLIAGERCIRPVMSYSGRTTFAIPHGCSEIRLHSAASRPTDTRPWLEDRRLLGLSVRHLRLNSRDTLPLDGEGIGGGWWPIEPGPSRWTAGDGCVRLPLDTHLLDISLRT